MVRTPRALDPMAIRYGADGLVAAIVQDAEDGRVLMVGWQDAEAVEATVRTGFAHFHSRSQKKLWKKGETSGNTLAVESLALDCDADAILISARPSGPTCHTGARSCFDESAAMDEQAATHGLAAAGDPTATTTAPTTTAIQDFAWLEGLWSTIADRAVERPPGSYTTSLLDGGVDMVARKVAEEANEVVMAAKDDEAAERHGEARPDAQLAGEIADLLYHSLVLCAERGLRPAQVIEVLKGRHSS